jgi:hypothetical protein
MHEVESLPHIYSKIDKFYIIYIFIYANILLSPLIRIIPLPVREIYAVMYLVSLVIFVSVSQKRKMFFNGKLILLCLFFASIFCITGIYYQSIDIALFNNVFLFTLVLFFLFKKEYTEPFIDISSWFIFILIAGAFIGFVYALNGGRSIFDFSNPDGRINHIYLTTTSNSVMGKIIRPAGIYDEPGALSFFICSICLLRTLYHNNDNITFFFLLGGIITFSLAHLIVFICFIVYYLCNYYKKKKTILYVVVAIFVCIVFIGFFYESFEKRFFSRLRIDNSTGLIAGDTRTNLFNNAFKLLDLKVFFWGFDKTMYSSNPSVTVGENPLMPIVNYGLFNSGYYYIFLSIIFLSGMIQRRYFFIILAVCLLFFQRPYSNKACYSFYFVLFFVHAVNVLKKEMNKNGKLKYLKFYNSKG